LGKKTYRTKKKGRRGLKVLGKGGYFIYWREVFGQGNREIGYFLRERKKYNKKRGKEKKKR